MKMINKSTRKIKIYSIIAVLKIFTVKHFRFIYIYYSVLILLLILLFILLSLIIIFFFDKTEREYETEGRKAECVYDMRYSPCNQLSTGRLQEKNVW